MGLFSHIQLEAKLIPAGPALEMFHYYVMVLE